MFDPWINKSKISAHFRRFLINRYIPIAFQNVWHENAQEMVPEWMNIWIKWMTSYVSVSVSCCCLTSRREIPVAYNNRCFFLSWLYSASQMGQLWAAASVWPSSTFLPSPVGCQCSQSTFLSSWGQRCERKSRNSQGFLRSHPRSGTLVLPFT